MAAKSEHYLGFYRSPSDNAINGDIAGRRESADDGPKRDWGKVVARLQRFYGGDPLRWFEMPVFYIRSFLHAMDELDAEDSLAQIVIGSASVGMMTSDNLRDLLAKLQRLSYGGDVEEPKRDAGPATLAYMGIGVVIEEKKNG